MKEASPVKQIRTSTGELTHIRDSRRFENPLMQINTLLSECPDTILAIDTNHPHVLPDCQKGERWIKIQNIQYIIDKNDRYPNETTLYQAPTEIQKED